MLELNKIYFEDCLEGMKKISDNSIDLICVDPPYFKISKDNYDYKFKDADEWKAWMMEWTKLSFEKLKDGGSFYVFGGIGTKNKFIFWDYIKEVGELYTFCSYINWKRFRPKGYKGKHNNLGDCREDI